MNSSDTDAWLDSFSLSACRPMVRLASGSDPTYLASAGHSHRARCTPSPR